MIFRWWSRGDTSKIDDETCSKEHITFACIVITAGISGIAIVGWILNWLIITRIRPEYIPMAPSTAISFFVLSIALLVYTRKPSISFGKELATIGTFLISLICFIILVEFLTGSTFDIENLLLPDPEKFGQVPIGRMSPLTAIDFLLAGAALLLLLTSKEGRQRNKSAAAILSIFVFLLGFVFTLGYLYGAPFLYGGTIIPVALTTAIAFVFLGAGLININGWDYWPMNSFIGPTVYARLMRVFVPVIVVLTLIQGWLNVVIVPITGNYVLTTTLVVLLSAIIIGLIVLKLAQAIGGDIDRANIRQKQAEEALKIYSQDLELNKKRLDILLQLSQLSALETKRDNLLQKACNTLVEASSYDGAWIGLLQNGESFTTAKGSFSREDISRLNEYVVEGNPPSCTSKMLAGNDMHILMDRSRDCGGCPLCDACSGKEIAIVRIKHAGRLFGLLAVSVIADHGVNEEEERFLQEVSDDMGIALSKIEIDEARKNTENELRDSEIKLSQIVDGNPTPTFVIDIEHNVTHWNKPCENLTQVSADEIIGKNIVWSHFYPEERPVMADQIVDGAARDYIASYYGGKCQRSPLIDGGYEAEDFFPDLGDSGKWLFLTASPLKDRHGKVVGAIETMQDITLSKQAEEDIRKLNEELELRIKDRTAELEDKYAELEQVNKLFVGREIRMGELKKQIDELEKRLDQ